MREVMGPDLWYFIWSVVCGIVLGFMYDILRLKRKIKKTSDIVVNVEDIMFIILGGGVATTLAYWINNGFFRVYSIISMMLGFCLYRIIIGNRIVGLFLYVYGLLCKGIGILFKILLMPVRATARIMGKTIFITLGRSRVLNRVKEAIKRVKTIKTEQEI